MEMMFQPLRRYADFEGRSRRSEYWMFALFHVLVVLAWIVVILIGAVATPRNGEGGSIVLSIIFSLLGLVFIIAWFGFIIPSLAVAVRRLHDTDKSGWMIFIGFVPLIGGVLLLIFYCTDGTPGPNRFGPDPKGRGANSTVETFS